MPFALNDICFENGWQKSDGPKQVVSDVQGEQIGMETRPGLNLVTYSGTFSTNDPDLFEDLLDFFAAKRFTRSFDWTPPDEVSPMKFRFAQFTAAVGRPFTVNATLEKYLGV
jgi:phage-related protein